MLGSAPADMRTWYKVQGRLRSELPEDVRGVLERGEREQRFEGKEYEGVMDAFYARHLFRGSKWPEEVNRAAGAMMAEPTVMQTMYVELLRYSI